jgi:transcriptional regulator with XRE-family HTH domain
MNFAQKLRALRKSAKMSQEQLAAKIGVSRQAITKWETDGGLPDIENIMAIAALFSVSMDELLSTEKIFRTVPEFAYESVTEYDVAAKTEFDIHAPGAKEITVTQTQGEKIRVRLCSNVLSSIQKDYKVALDERKNRMDVDIRKTSDAAEREAKDALFIEITLPQELTGGAELAVQAQTLHLKELNFPLEFDGKVSSVNLSSVSGSVTLDCSSDMEIRADTLPEALEINQINATSTLYIPKDAKFYTKVKGRSNHMRYVTDGKGVDFVPDENATNRVEIAGINCELTIEMSGK